MKKKEIQLKAGKVNQAAPALIVRCSAELPTDDAAADYGLMFIRNDPPSTLTPSITPLPKRPRKPFWGKVPR